MERYLTRNANRVILGNGVTNAQIHDGEEMMKWL
jgi:hypothetical protein